MQRARTLRSLSNEDGTPSDLEALPIEPCSCSVSTSVIKDDFYLRRGSSRRGVPSGGTIARRESKWVANHSLPKSMVRPVVFPSKSFRDQKTVVLIFQSATAHSTTHHNGGSIEDLGFSWHDIRYDICGVEGRATRRWGLSLSFWRIDANAQVC